MAETDHVIPFTSSTDYTVRWEVMAATLREQAAQFDFSLKDRRDASYWEIVTPLFEEMESMASSVRTQFDQPHRGERHWNNFHASASSSEEP